MSYMEMISMEIETTIEIHSEFWHSIFQSKLMQHKIYTDMVEKDFVDEWFEFQCN